VVYDPSDNLIASGGPWTCEERGAYMERVPAGSNLTFIILGWDTADGNIIYQGSTASDVNITAGETTDAGTITADPFVPTALEARAVSTNQIELTWSDQGASGYRIYQDGVVAATPTTPSFAISELTPNTEYCYAVSALDVYGNESGRSHPSCATTGAEDDTQAPSDPTTPNAVAVSASQIDITWTASTDNVGVSGYRIYENGQEVGTVTAPSFSHEGLSAAIEYCYTIEAFDASGNRSNPTAPPVCATTSATTDTEPPTQPQGLGVVATADQIDLSWEASSDNVGVAGYRVYQSDQEVGTTTALSFSHVGLQVGTEYCYTVVAFDAAGNVSPPSNEVCASTSELFVWYRDFDQDTFGDPAVSIEATVQPTGYVENNTDCDDTIDTIYPGAGEVCNNRDDNCNTEVDEGCTANLSASFTTQLVENYGVLMYDASDRENESFNSNSLFVGGPQSERIGLEFDISYPTSSGTVTLQFEMYNTNAPGEYFYGRLHTYTNGLANGLANANDHLAANAYQYLDLNSDEERTGWHTYTFDVTNWFLAFKESGQQYMGISIAAIIDTNARCEIRNPTLTVTQAPAPPTPLPVDAASSPTAASPVAMVVIGGKPD
jgi:chitodextrinase